MNTPPPRKTEARRYAALDIMRSACILYIVGFWHLFNYTHALPGSENAVTYRLTVVVLGLFVLISGFLIGRKDIGPTRAEVLGFYKTRLLRIYPPYLFAILLFAILKIATLTALAKSVVLLSVVIAPAPFTLWFIVMLMNFYILAPFLIQARAKMKKFLLLCGALIAVLLGLNQLLHCLDVRIILYFPAFALGIFLAGRPSLIQTLSWPALLTGAAGSLLLSGFDTMPVESSLTSLPLATLMPLLVFILMMRHDARIRETRPVTMIAYASFFMYLFHRPVYKLVTYIYLPASDSGQIAFLLCVCLPLAIVLSWSGQKIYDRLVPYLLPLER